MKNKKLIKEIILEINPKALFLEDIFNNALIGISIPCGKKHVATYDSNKCIKILMKTFKIGESEAYEQFLGTSEFSIANENKPIFFSNFSNIEEPDIKEIDLGDDINKLI